MTNISGIIKSIRDIMWQDTGLNGDAQRIEQLGWMLFLKIFSDKDRELELLNDHHKRQTVNKQDHIRTLIASFFNYCKLIDCKKLIVFRIPEVN